MLYFKFGSLKPIDMKKLFLLALTTSLAFGLKAQKPNLPDDFLPMEFHDERRELVREKMPENSVAVFFANPVRNRANDVDYMYH